MKWTESEAESKRNAVIGQVFGLLRVVGWERYQHNESTAWKVKCRCGCGNERLVVVGSLISGRTKTCGSRACRELLFGPRSQPHPFRAPEYLVGQMFGNLMVLSVYLHTNPGGSRIYKAQCRCVCGDEKSYQTGYLRNGKAISCGVGECRRPTPTGKANKRYTGHEGITGRYWHSIRKGAAERGYDFTLTLEEAWSQFEVQNGCCALTGVAISFESGKRWGTASLDRINNDRGYEAGNVQWVHKRINRLRGEYTLEEFDDWCVKRVAWMSLEGGFA